MINGIDHSNRVKYKPVMKYKLLRRKKDLSGHVFISLRKVQKVQWLKWILPREIKILFVGFIFETD